jgi:ABC-2 type transport system permease protein
MGLANPIPINSGLDAMLASYGVKLDRALVQDRQCENAGFSQGYIRYTVPYPLWPKIAGKGLSQENPITSRLDALVLPWCSPLQVLVAEAPAAKGGPAPAAPADSPQPDVKATVLARTTATAWLQKGRFDLTPPGPMQQVRVPEKGESYPVAVALVGRFRSFFAGKPVPAVPGDSTGVDSGGATVPESPQDTQILVVGNSQIANGNFISMFPGNQKFVLNSIDWMTLGDKLIAIRSRGASDRPLGIESPTGRMFFRYGNTFGMAILVAVFGLVRFSVRRRIRREAAATPTAG